MSTQSLRPQAERYITDHRIKELFGHLIQLLTFYRPKNIRAFLKEELQRMASSKEATQLFTDEDLLTMFEMTDVTKQRTISTSQLRNACRNLSANGNEATDSLKDVGTDGRVSIDEFKRVLSAQLSTTNYW